MTEPVPTSPLALSRLIAWVDVPGDGLHVRLTATPAECAALAEALEIVAVKTVAADLEIKPWHRSGFHITGRVEASVVQTCVVSLDPVDEQVSEVVDVKLLPEAELEAFLARLAARAEEEGDEMAEDPPEAIEGPTYDIGTLVAEFVAVGLDPYPRKAGAVFDPAAFGVAETPIAPVSPFASLKALKRD